MTTFYAQPFSIDHTGFYFEDIAEYDAGMEKLNARGCEEVEIQFIVGEPEQSRLARSVGIDQATITEWFDELEDLESTEIDQLCFLLDCGYDLDRAVFVVTSASLWLVR